MTVHQRVRQEFFIIPLGKVRALMSATRFRALPGALDDRFGHVEHKREFERRGQFGIEGVAVILDGHVPKPFMPC